MVLLQVTHRELGRRQRLAELIHPRLEGVLAPVLFSLQPLSVTDVQFVEGVFAQAFGVETDSFGKGLDASFTTGALSGLT